MLEAIFAQGDNKPRHQAPIAAVTATKIPFSSYFRKHYWLYLMLIPGIIWFFVFRYLPIYGIVAAFQDYNLYDGYFGSPWVGFQWFKIMFNDPNFFRILFNTLKFSIASLVFGFPFPIIFAILLNELGGRRYKKFVQTVTYLPHFFTWVVCGGLVIQFLSWNGPVNTFLANLGVKKFNFLSHAQFFLPIYVLSGIWKSFGWASIIYLAAITGINPELYEAATVDGAGRFRQAWHVTIPGIKHIMAISLILQSGNILRVGFEQIFILSSDIIRSSTDVFATYVYRVGILQGAYSYTAAIGLWQAVVGVILVVMTNRFAKLVGETGIW